MSHADFMRKIATGAVPAPGYMDTRAVYVAGELEGFEVFDKYTGRALTSVQCCCSCAWRALG